MLASSGFSISCQLHACCVSTANDGMLQCYCYPYHQQVACHHPQFTVKYYMSDTFQLHWWAQCQIKNAAMFELERSGSFDAAVTTSAGLHVSPTRHAR